MLFMELIFAVRLRKRSVADKMREQIFKGKL